MPEPAVGKKAHRAGRPPWLGIFVALALIATGGAFLWTSLVSIPEAPGISATALYATRLPDPQGKPVALAQWQGKILLINFWATWCAPCREEMPLLIDTQRRYAGDDVQIVGIGIDSSTKIINFTGEMGINYPILADEAGGLALSKRLGNRLGVLPFTALIDREGKVIATKAGPWTAGQLQDELRKALGAGR